MKKQSSKNTEDYLVKTLNLVLPKTPLGRLSSILAIIWLIMIQVLLFIMAKLETKDGPVLVVSWSLLLLIGGAALIAGFLSIWKQKERSSTAVTITLFGFLIMLVFAVAVLSD